MLFLAIESIGSVLCILLAIRTQKEIHNCCQLCNSWLLISIFFGQSLVERLSKSGEQDNFTDAIKDQVIRDILMT